MTQFTPDYLAEVSRRMDIAELIGGYVELKRAGRTMKGLCPFHNEKTPSFTVYPDDGSFHCFGCGTGGDAITFTMKIQNLTFPEAVRFLAGRTGMPLPDEDDEAGKARRRMLGINREAAKFYASMLNTDAGRGARGYLRQRGLTDGMIRHFGLGFAPDSFGAALNHLKSAGYKEDELLAVGIVKRSQKGGLYDTFRNRLMFPIIDLQGGVIGFGARIMGEGGPKYLNSSDSPLFKKSRGLFALNFAKKSPSKRYILAEGYMDVISLHQAGFTTAVASLGTALTEEQAKLLSNYAEEIVICYDGDEAGQKATQRAIEKLSKTPMKVRVLTLPDAKDPDEFIKKFGGVKFEELLEGSGNTTEYALAKLKKKFDLATPDGRLNYIKAALDVLAANALPAERDIYAGRVAEETDVSKAAVLSQLDGVLRQHRRQAQRERERRIMDEGNAASVNITYRPAGDKTLAVEYAERQLVVAGIKNPEVALPLAEAAVKPEDFISPEYGKLYGLVLDMWRSGVEPSITTIGAGLEQREVDVLSKALAMNHDAAFTQKDVEILLGRIKGGAGITKEELMSEDKLRARLEDIRKQKQ